MNMIASAVKQTSSDINISCQSNAAELLLRMQPMPSVGLLWYYLLVKIDSDAFLRLQSFLGNRMSFIQLIGKIEINSQRIGTDVAIHRKCLVKLGEKELDRKDSGDATHISLIIRHTNLYAQNGQKKRFDSISFSRSHSPATSCTMAINSTELVYI